MWRRRKWYMIPQLTPLNGVVAGVPVQVPPPPRFRPIVGPITNVWLNEHHPFKISKGRTGSQKAGLKYEGQVHKFLSSVYRDRFVASPALHFQNNFEPRVCIPDGLILKQGTCVIVEIKLQHMPEAWWQLRKLYEPVLRVYCPKDTRVLLLEICRVYDSSSPFPEEFRFLDSLNEWITSAPDADLAVLRWKP